MSLTMVFSILMIMGGCQRHNPPAQLPITPENNLPEIAQLWNFQDPSATEETFRRLLPKIPADSLSYQLQVQTQIARTYGLRIQFEAAHLLLDSVASQLQPSYTTARLRYHLERGRAYNSNMVLDSAIVHFQQAWAIGQVHGPEVLAIDAAHMLGIAAPEEEQLTWNLKALKMAETASTEAARSWLGSLYNNIGWTYHDQGDYELALDHFLRGLEWRISVNDIQGAQIARWTVARTYRSLGRTTEALELQRALRQEISTNKQNPDGYVHEELGELFLMLDQPDSAQVNFLQAFDILSMDPWMQKYESDRLARLKSLGKTITP